ncbi:Uncharacterised protein [Mycobacterium tuberculosis]|nr:Uncharacterised protein [Mycobacterium tuberculosis]
MQSECVGHSPGRETVTGAGESVRSFRGAAIRGQQLVVAVCQSYEDTCL